MMDVWVLWFDSYRLFLYRFLNLRLVSWKVLRRVATCEEQVSRQSVDSDLVEICIQTEKLNDQAMACSHTSGWGGGQFWTKRVLTATYKI